MVAHADGTGPGNFKRRFAIGAEPAGTRGTHFRVWAPKSTSVSIVERFASSEQHGRALRLTPEPEGYHSGWFAELGDGARYSVQLDSGVDPDPASRFPPEGPPGPSQVVDAQQFRWTDAQFASSAEARVIYELHVGTFTPEGSYRAAARELPELASLGITMVELMALATFPGQRGWSYDGVDLWAPTR